MKPHQELLLLRLLRSLPVYVVAVAENGAIMHVSTGAPDEPSTVASGFGEVVGTCYLARLNQLALQGDAIAAEMLNGLSAVLRGERTHFTVEYTRPGGESPRSFLTRIDRIGTPAGGAVICHLDTTQRSRAEEGLRQIHDRYAFATRAGGVGLWDLNLRSRELYVDPALIELLGFAGTAVGSTVQDWSAIVMREDRTAFRAAALRCLRGETAEFEVEHRMLAAHGGAVWFLTRGHVVHCPNGQPSRLVGLSTNITARKDAELAIERQREKYLQLFDGAGVAMWEADYSVVARWLRRLRNRGVSDLASYLKRNPDSVRSACAAVKFRGVNAEAVRLVDAGSRSRLLDLRLPDLLLDAERQFREQLLALAEGRTSFEAEAAIRTLTGERRDVLIVVRFGEAEELDGVLLCVHDVTQLIERRRRYHLAAAAGGVTVFEFDLALLELKTDPPLNALLGLEPDQPTTFKDIIAQIHPDDRPRVLSLERGLQADDAPRGTDGNTPIPEFEFRLIDPDGERRWCLKRGSVIRGPDGTARKLVGTITDITDRKRMERNVRQSHERVHELVRHLIAAQEHEQTRIARDLHDGMGAEMAQVIAGVAELETLIAGQPEAVRREVLRLGYDLRCLEESIRSLSREMHPGTIDRMQLLPALRQLCHEFARLEDVDIAFKADLADESTPPEVTMSLYRITQEALRNIARHSGAQNAEVSLRRNQQALELCIRDWGCGFRVRAALSSGLGLLGIQERARLAGGQAFIYSVPGGGTEVTVIVPITGV